jgi:hypothetical protein
MTSIQEKIWEIGQTIIMTLVTESRCHDITSLFSGPDRPKSLITIRTQCHPARLTWSQTYPPLKANFFPSAKSALFCKGVRTTVKNSSSLYRILIKNNNLSFIPVMYLEVIFIGVLCKKLQNKEIPVCVAESYNKNDFPGGGLVDRM